jgi:oligopeptidase B
VEWAADNATLFYIIRDEATRPYQLYRHTLGTNPAQDELIYHEADETYYLFLLKSRSEQYLMAFSHSTLTFEWRILPADQPRGEWRIFAPRRAGIEYSIEHHGERFFVLTNENALNFKLMDTPVDATSPENWREVLPHRSAVFLENVLAFEDHLCYSSGSRSAADSPRPSIVGDVRYVPFPEPVYSTNRQPILNSKHICCASPIHRW